MNKNLKAIVLLLLLALSVPLCAEVKDTVLTFDRNLLQMETVMAGDGQSYVKIVYPNCRAPEAAGFPELPVFHAYIMLPSGAEGISVSAQAQTTGPIQLDKPIYPVQYAAFTGVEESVQMFVPINVQSYVEKMQGRWAEVSDVSNWDGTCRMVGVDLYPVMYSPDEGTCSMANEIRVRLDYKISHEAKKSFPAFMGKNIGLPYYRYCIVTSKKLEDSFLRLVGWLKQKGMDAGVVCVDDILSCDAIVGDTVSALYDDAGKLRQYLQYAYRFGGTEYVLFGGDNTVLPIRYGRSNGKNIFSMNYENLHIPSDFYFSELTSNWNQDGDEDYGEKEEITEYRSQLKVGRLLCNCAEEVDNYMDKLLRYEMKPGNGDEDYLRRIFFTQADNMQVAQQAEMLASYISDVYPEQTIVSCGRGDEPTDTTDYTGADIVNMMKRRYGYVSWLNHGAPTALAIKNKKDEFSYAVTPVSGDVSADVVHESDNGLEKLDNKDYPMVAYTIACTTTPFDDFDEKYAGHANLGRSFTVGQDYGGPMYIGNTRVGLEDFTYLVQQQFYFNIHESTVAEALNLAKYYDHKNRHHNALVVNLIGIPDLYIWTEKPKRFNASIEYYEMSADLTTESEIKDAYWSVWRLNEEKDSLSRDWFNPTYIQSSLLDIENGVITLTGRNCIPQVMPLRLRNVRLHGNRYLLLSDAKVGAEVKEEEDSPVVFDSDSETTIEHDGNIRFEKNVAVEKGATLKIISSRIR